MGLVKRSEISATPVMVEEPTNTINASMDTSALLKVLENSPVEDRRHAATALAGRTEALSAMVGHLMREANMSVRAGLFATLINMPSAETARLLVRLLQSEDANLRNEAIEVLSTMPDAVEPLMESMLTDPDSDVRIFAVNIMASIQHLKVVEWLIEIVERDTETNVCAMALDLMTEVGDERCLPALEQARARFADEPYLQFVIDLAHSRIAGQQTQQNEDVA